MRVMATLWSFLKLSPLLFFLCHLGFAEGDSRLPILAPEMAPAGSCIPLFRFLASNGPSEYGAYERGSCEKNVPRLLAKFKRLPGFDINRAFVLIFRGKEEGGETSLGRFTGSARRGGGSGALNQSWRVHVGLEYAGKIFDMDYEPEPYKADMASPRTFFERMFPPTSPKVEVLQYSVKLLSQTETNPKIVVRRIPAAKYKDVTRIGMTRQEYGKAWLKYYTEPNPDLPPFISQEDYLEIIEPRH